MGLYNRENNNEGSDEVSPLFKKTKKFVSLDKPLSESEKLSKEIKRLLDLRIENEIMFSKLIKDGTSTDQISVESAAALHNRSKESISELIKIHRLITGQSTGENVVNNNVLNIDYNTLDEKRLTEIILGRELVNVLFPEKKSKISEDLIYNGFERKSKNKT